MFGFNFLEVPRPFNTQYRCYSVSMLPGQERQDVEKGGKIIMPPSALDHLTRLNIVYPMLFKLTNRRAGRVTHSGVLEFVADEGKMMRNLLLDEGDLIQIESATLPVATYSKFQPQSADFLDITNPKAVLENALRNFACLTTSDVIAINYNDRVYELCVLETKPGSAVSIIECDMNVEFAPPVGYVEPEVVRTKKKAEEDMDVFDPSQFAQPVQGFVAFGGQGARLDGKEKKSADSAPVTAPLEYKRGIPDYDYKIGTLKFLHYAKPSAGKEEKAEDISFIPFKGSGQSLRQSRKL